MLKNRALFIKRWRGESYTSEIQYRHRKDKKREDKMNTKIRVLESKLAVKISSNPDLAKEFGLVMSINKESSEDENLDNRISFLTSTEAYE